MPDYTQAQTWVDKLAALRDQQAQIEQSVDGHLGLLSVDQKSAYERTMNAIQECQGRIAAFGPNYVTPDVKNIHSETAGSTFD